MVFNNHYFILVLLLSVSQFFVDGFEDFGKRIKQKFTSGWRQFTSIFKQAQNIKHENEDSENTDSETTNSEITDPENINPELISQPDVPLSEVVKQLKQSSTTCVDEECKQQLETLKKLHSSVLAREDDVSINYEGRVRKISLKSLDEGERGKTLEFLSNMIHSILDFFIGIKNLIVGIFRRKKKSNKISAESDSENKNGKDQPLSTSSKPNDNILTPGNNNKISYYGQTQEDINSGNSQPVAQAGNANEIILSSIDNTKLHSDNVNSDELNHVPHSNQINVDDLKQNIPFAENHSDRPVDRKKAEIIIANFLKENFEPCDEKEAGRIIGVDSVTEGDR